MSSWGIWRQSPGPCPVCGVAHSACASDGGPTVIEQLPASAAATKAADVEPAPPAPPVGAVGRLPQDPTKTLTSRRGGKTARSSERARLRHDTTNATRLYHTDQELPLAATSQDGKVRIAGSPTTTRRQKKRKTADEHREFT